MSPTLIVSSDGLKYVWLNSIVCSTLGSVIPSITDSVSAGSADEAAMMLLTATVAVSVSVSLLCVLTLEHVVINRTIRPMAHIVNAFTAVSLMVPFFRGSGCH